MLKFKSKLWFLAQYLFLILFFTFFINTIVSDNFLLPDLRIRYRLAAMIVLVILVVSIIYKPELFILTNFS